MKMAGVLGSFICCYKTPGKIPYQVPNDGKKSNYGFTLIELLVVVLIIGILAAVAVPQYQAAVDKAKYTQAMMLMETVLKAEDVYRLANGKYTMRFDELDVDLPTPTSITDHADSFRYYYPWGNCYTHNTGYLACYATLGGGASAAYMAYFNLQTGKNCWAYPKDNARANRLCKAVTKKSTGTGSNGGGFTSYRFP